MTTVQYGNYLSFEWFYDGRVDVIETSKNHSKVAVKLKALGHPNITCIVHHPAYPDGIPVDFSQILLVVIKPGPIAIGAVGDITSAELTAGTLNITFYIRYTAGPDNALVELWGDYANGPLSGETISKCETEVLTLVVCRAYASHVYNKAGLYNVTMLLMVGDEPYYKSMSFEVIPPKMLLAFTDPHRIVAGQLPIYYFHANDTAKFNVELQSTESITLPITYRWSFGDQEMQFEEAGFHTNISHKYTSIREAGFTVSVVASNTEISMEAIAMAIIYKPIQRVELLVEGRSWTEENQGKLYFLPDELINSLHLIVKVYPENVPFESCHIVKGTPYDEPTVTNTFFPENTEVDMHAYDSNFIVVNNRPILRRLVVSALCVNVRLPDVPINKVHAEVLTIYRRTPILRMYYQHPSAASPKIKIGNNLTYDCRGLDNSNDGYYTHYLDGEIIAEGMGQALVTFTPMRDDVYNLTCHIDNGVSEKSFTMLLPVTNFACDVTLIIKSKSLPNAEAVVLPSQWYSSEAITLQGLMKRDGCQADNDKANTYTQNIFQATNWSMSWEVKKMEGDSLVEVGVYIPPFSDLYLPPRTLAPGNYIISWNVSIVGTKFKQSVSERLIISPTPFRAVIAGGIARKLGASIEQDVELDGSMSYDPDCPDCDDLQYLWACNILHKLNTSCFVNSSKIEFSAEKRTSINTASLAPSGQKEGYQISLVVFRGSRSVVVKQTLDTKQEDDSTISTRFAVIT
ncbi:uncharacterized protein [Watersipora subatra]|uniref:uncharacterized protein n=1 Tax=Watersipora subatra TaxID=2589382 RepID=UPI00355BC6AD